MMFKKIFFSFLFCLLSVFVFGQFTNNIPLSGSNANTKQSSAGGLAIAKMLQVPIFVDTLNANNGVANKYAGAVIFTTGDNKFWCRNSTATKWLLLSEGSCPPRLISGGVPILVDTTEYNVGAATYTINCNIYSSPFTNLILPSATSDPRFDAFIVDTFGVASYIAGTPAVNPQFPTYDPQYQLVLDYLLVTDTGNTIIPVNPFYAVDSITSLKQGCLDIQSYWIGGAAVSYDTIQIYNGIISAGEITETSPQNFQVTQFLYKIDCVQHSTPSPDTTLVTLGYDTLPRFYSVVANTQNQAVLLVGEESLNPTPPEPSPDEILLGYIYETSVGDTIIPIPPTNDIWAGRFRNDSIYGKWTYFNDTFWLKHFPISDPFFTYPSPVIGWQTQALDTPSLNQIPVTVTAGVRASTGGSIPNFGWSLRSSYNTTATLKTLIDANGANGTVSLYNQISFPGTTTGAILSAGNTMKFQSTNTTLKYDFQNPGAPLGSNGVFMRLDNGTTTGGSNSALLYGRGNNLLPLFYFGSEQNAGFGTTTPAATAAMDITSSAGGLLIPRMSTSVRDGLGNWVQTVTLTNGGSGYNSAPSVSISGVIGKSPRITATVSGGAVTALTIDYAGTGIPASGSLVFNNTGTGGTAAAGTFTRSTGNTIAQWSMIINTDSTTCPIEVWNGSDWISACGSGGGGGSQDLSSVLGIGNTASNNIFLSRPAGDISLLGSSTRTILTINNTPGGENAAIYTDETDSSAVVQVNASSACGGFLRAQELYTELTLNAPDDEANGRIRQDATRLGIKETEGIISGTGTGELQFPTIADLHNNNWTWLLPNKSGTFAMLSDITSGTVTSVATGYGLTGGTITTSGTLSLDSATVYSYVRSLITSGTSGSLTFNTDQFTIDTLGGNPDSLQATIKNTSYANMLAFFGPDGKLIANDSLKWSLGSLNIKGNASIDGESSHGLLINGLLSVIGDFYGNHGGTMVRVNGAVYTVGIGDVDDNNNGTVQTLDDDAQTITLTAANGIIISTVPEYADNAAAISAGLVVGTIYRTGDDLKIVH